MALHFAGLGPQTLQSLAVFQPMLAVQICLVEKHPKILVQNEPDRQTEQFLEKSGKRILVGWRIIEKTKQNKSKMFVFFPLL